MILHRVTVNGISIYQNFQGCEVTRFKANASNTITQGVLRIKNNEHSYAIINKNNMKLEGQHEAKASQTFL